MPESNTQTNNPLDSTPEPEPEPSGSGESESLVIEIANQHSLSVSEDQIRAIVAQIFSDYNWQRGEVSIAIVDDKTIHELNRQYLKHDYETDVLSFVFNSNEETRSLDGEIIVSADTAAAMATEHQVETLDELLLYVIHGALHLAGLDDKDASKRVQMRDAERKYTEQFGIRYVRPDEPDAVDGDGGHN